jgi:hypothetical protein
VEKPFGNRYKSTLGTQSGVEKPPFSLKCHSEPSEESFHINKF